MVFVVLNKMDIKTFEDLEPEMQTELEDLTKSGDVELLRASCATQDGVQDVKNLVCERLLAERVSQKLKAGTASNGTLGSRLTEVMARIHVAQPMDGITKETFIPDAVKGLKKYDKSDPNRRFLARDEEEANGGAGVFNVDLRKDYLLADPSWKYDKIPEILDGKNVYDYVDPDIESKLAALEEEEERLEKEGFYESDEDLGDESEEEVLQKAEYIREKHKLIRNEAQMRKSLKNRALIPRKAQKKPFSQLEDHLDQLGVDTEAIGLRARAEVQETRGRSLARSRTGTVDPDAMDVDNGPSAKERLRSKSRVRDRSVMATNRRDDGVVDELARSKAERVAKLGQRKMNRMARQGEADRHIGATMPKHLVCYPHSQLYVLLLRIGWLTVCFYLSNSSPASGRLARLLVVKPFLSACMWSKLARGVETRSVWCGRSGVVGLVWSVWCGRSGVVGLVWSVWCGIDTQVQTLAS
jgi:nucleolar GTP-binding protein